MPSTQRPEPIRWGTAAAAEVPCIGKCPGACRISINESAGKCRPICDASEVTTLLIGAVSCIQERAAAAAGQGPDRPRASHSSPHRRRRCRAIASTSCSRRSRLPPGTSPRRSRMDRVLHVLARRVVRRGPVLMVVVRLATDHRRARRVRRAQLERNPGRVGIHDGVIGVLGKIRTGRRIVSRVRACHGRRWAPCLDDGGVGYETPLRVTVHGTATAVYGEGSFPHVHVALTSCGPAPAKSSSRVAAEAAQTRCPLHVGVA